MVLDILIIALGDVRPETSVKLELYNYLDLRMVFNKMPKFPIMPLGKI